MGPPTSVGPTTSPVRLIPEHNAVDDPYPWLATWDATLPLDLPSQTEIPLTPSLLMIAPPVPTLVGAPFRFKILKSFKI